MDPISLIGLAGSVTGIIDIIAKSIKSLRDLQQRWNAADWTVISFTCQLNTLRTALNRISEWMSLRIDENFRHDQLILELSESLKCCWDLVNFMDKHLSPLEWLESNRLTSAGKFKAVFHESEMKECAAHLNHQSIALNLLLTALTWLVMTYHPSLVAKSRIVSHTHSENLYYKIKETEEYSVKSRMIHPPCVF